MINKVKEACTASFTYKLNGTIPNVQRLKINFVHSLTYKLTANP